MEATKILLIEDCESDADLFCIMLAQQVEDCFRVEVAERLAVALAKIASTKFDVVLLDLQLPDSRGLATLQAVREAGPHLAIVVLTGTDDRDLALSALREGAQDYLVKLQVDAPLLGRSVNYALFRRQIEIRLAEQQFRQRTLMDSIEDVRIYFKDLDGRFLEVNPALARLYGLSSPQELVGRTDFDLFAPEHAERARADELEVIRTGRPLVGKVEREMLPDGQVFWAITTKMPLRNHAGVTIGTFGVSRDVTELKLAEERLTEANAHLSDAVAALTASHDELRTTQLQLIQAEKLQSLGQMAASVAHEVKNPLAILRMGIECLREYFDGGDERMNCVVFEMEGAANRAEAVIRDMLDYSSARNLLLQDISLNDLVQQTLRFVKHELNKGRVRPVLDLAPRPPICRLDVTKCEQALVNLFLNACQAMPKGGNLWIRTYTRMGTLERGEDDGDIHFLRAAGEHFPAGEPLAVIEIRDSGTGIAEESLPRVFDPFFTTKPQGKGTGLGLSVVKKIIDLHHGSIRLDNAAEGGLRVTICLSSNGVAESLPITSASPEIR